MESGPSRVLDPDDATWLGLGLGLRLGPGSRGGSAGDRGGCGLGRARVGVRGWAWCVVAGSRKAPQRRVQRGGG